MPHPDDPSTTQVLYASRRQCDDWVEHAQKNGPPLDLITFAQRADPCVGLFGKITSSWRVLQRQRRAKSLENVAVTVQLDVPGLRPSKTAAARPAPEGGCRSRPTAWLGTDANMLREIDAETLDPVGFGVQKDLHPSLDGPLTCAHDERCPVTGDYFNVNIKPGASATYRVFRVSAESGETEILAEFSRVGLPMAYIHSFFLSEHFVVLRVPTTHIRAYGMSMVWERNIREAMVPFDQRTKCKWFVIDRLHGHGVVAEFETAAAFFFHTVNCFEVAVEPDGPQAAEQRVEQRVDIFCDVVEYPTTDVIEALYYEVMVNHDGRAKGLWGDAQKAANALPRLARWRFAVSLPPPSQVCIKEPWPVWSLWSPLSWLLPRDLMPQPPARPAPERVFSISSPHAGELPTINPAYHTRPHRYVYSLAMSGLSTLMDSILKTDTQTRAVLRWNNPRGHTPGEAIFVARPGAAREDDGVLLSVVLDGTCGKSYLLCLDAETMRERGRAEMDFAVAFGFHGVHATTAAVKPTRA